MRNPFTTIVNLFGKIMQSLDNLAAAVTSLESKVATLTTQNEQLIALAMAAGATDAQIDAITARVNAVNTGLDTEIANDTAVLSPAAAVAPAPAADASAIAPTETPSSDASASAAPAVA